MVKRTARFYGPIVELSRLQGELNRMFAAFVETNNAAGAPAATSWDPNVDVLDDGEAIRILVELPGVEAGDVRVSIRGKVVMIRGTKKGRIRTREGMRFFLSLIHISEPTRLALISYAVFCLKKFFFNDTATTEIYTLHIVGSVRCV